MSVANTVTGQALIGLGFGVLHWPASRAALVATVVVCIPAFVAYQRWVWCHDGPTRLSAHVLPFAVISLAGLVASTQAAAAAERFGITATSNRTIQTVLVMVSTTASLLLLWAIRFLLFQSVFRPRSTPSVSAPLAAGSGSP